MTRVTLEPQLLTAAGREHVEERLDRALEALARLALRMSAGERTPEQLAEHRWLLHRVDALNAVLAQAVDVAAVAENPSVVELGDQVDVEADDGDVTTYALVHPAEAHLDGRVTAASPLGRALLGARPGDRIRVDAPAGTYTLTIRQRRRLT